MRSLTRVAAAFLISLPLPVHAKALPEADNTEPPSISLAYVVSGSENLHLQEITVGTSFEDQNQQVKNAQDVPGGTKIPETYDLSSIRQYAEQLCDQTFGIGQFQYLDYIIVSESGWNPLAEEKSSHAYGLGQALPASKMAPFGGDYLTDPITQLRWLMSYITGRYETPEKAWTFHLAHHWY